MTNTRRDVPRCQLCGQAFPPRREQDSYTGCCNERVVWHDHGQPWEYTQAYETAMRTQVADDDNDW